MAVWSCQLRGRIRDRVDAAIAADLAGLLRGGGGHVVASRSGHALPTHLPHALAHGMPPGTGLPGPAFGPWLGYDGSRFDGIAGARVEGGELLLGILAHGLERELAVEPDGTPAGGHASRLHALLDFLGRVLAGPPGEVVGRMDSGAHGFAHPVVRCADGRLRLAHASGLARDAGPGLALPRDIPARFVHTRDEAVADLDEDALLAWLLASALDGGTGDAAAGGGRGAGRAGTG